MLRGKKKGFQGLRFSSYSYIYNILFFHSLFFAFLLFFLKNARNSIFLKWYFSFGEYAWNSVVLLLPLFCSQEKINLNFGIFEATKWLFLVPCNFPMIWGFAGTSPQTTIIINFLRCSFFSFPFLSSDLLLLLLFHLLLSSFRVYY